MRLGAELGLAVVADGVETEEALMQLGRAGCDGAQGYLISPPLPAPAFAAWLERGDRST